MLKLKKREIRLGVMVGFLWVFSHFWNQYYKPNQSRIFTLKNALLSNQIALEAMKNESPPIAAKAQAIKELENEIMTGKKSYAELIKAIPSKNIWDQLLNHLGVISENQQVTILQLKPVEDRQKFHSVVHQDGDKSASGNIHSGMRASNVPTNSSIQDYEYKNFECKLKGEFAGMVRVLDYLNAVSTFSAIESVSFFKEDSSEMSKSDSSQERNLVAVIKLKFLVTNHSESREKAFLSPSEFLTRIKVSQNPFEEIREPVVYAHEEQAGEEIPQMDVRGIVSAGGQFRVIILDKIYKEGETVGESVIQKIEKGKVVFKTRDMVHEIYVK